VFVASRIQKMESFQVVMQMLLMPMLFLSGALFPLNGLPGWLTVITRLNPLTYAVAPFRQVVFAAQNMSPAARARFPTNVTLFGHTCRSPSSWRSSSCSPWCSSSSPSADCRGPSRHHNGGRAAARTWPRSGSEEEHHGG